MIYYAPSRLNEPEQILYAHCHQLIGAKNTFKSAKDTKDIFQLKRMVRAESASQEETKFFNGKAQPKERTKRNHKAEKQKYFLYNFHFS